MYALKFEVGVQSSAPYYALFVNKGMVGSVHDFDVHKANSNTYAGYLQKTAHERTLIQSDRNNHQWALLGDKAYQSPQEDTPNVRRMFIKKNPISIQERTTNLKLA